MNLIKHLLSRNYDPTRYVNQVLDFDNKVLTVYLTNLVGQFVGFQQYRPEVEFKRLNLPSEARYFTYSQRGANQWVCSGGDQRGYGKTADEAYNEWVYLTRYNNDGRNW